MIESIHVYILLCADRSYYVGLTTGGLERRISEHNLGVFGGYTSKRGPVKRVWSEQFANMANAIACERRLKGWRRAKKEALIRGDFKLLSELSRTAKPRHGSTSSPWRFIKAAAKCLRS